MHVFKYTQRLTTMKYIKERGEICLLLLTEYVHNAKF